LAPPKVIGKKTVGVGTHVASKFLYEVANKGGKEIGAISGSTATSQHFKTSSIRFHLHKFVWLGSISKDVDVLAAGRVSSMRSIKEIFERKMEKSGSVPASRNVHFPKLSIELLGMKFEIIHGYKCLDKIELSIELGNSEDVMS
jgi:hypothetical protein